MERRENDKLLPEHAKDASYPEDWWLDEADSADGLPVFAMDEAEDFVKDRQRLKGVPMGMKHWSDIGVSADQDVN